jgi:hypothetical protein
MCGITNDDDALVGRRPDIEFGNNVVRPNRQCVGIHVIQGGLHDRWPVIISFSEQRGHTFTISKQIVSAATISDRYSKLLNLSTQLDK